MKILKINNRVFFAVVNAAFFSIFEILLARTPGFHWVYKWWGAFPVFITVYIPFFLAANFAYDWEPKRQKIFIGSLFGINALMLIVFAGYTWVDLGLAVRFKLYPAFNALIRIQNILFVA